MVTIAMLKTTVVVEMRSSCSIVEISAVRMTIPMIEL